MKNLEEKTKKSPLVNKRGRRPIGYEEESSGLRAVSEETDGVEVRKLRGYAILFDVLGKPWRGSAWQEKVSKSALDNVDFSQLILLWDHKTEWVLGRNGKNMRTEVDDTGLFVEVTLGSTWFDDYVYDRVQRGLVDGMSFYFDSNAIIATDWTNKIDVIAQINEIYEVSLLAFPAYDETLMITNEDEEETEPEQSDSSEIVNALASLIQQL